MTEEFVILIVSDEKYYKHLISLIASIDKNYPLATIWCHLINPSSIHQNLFKRKDIIFSSETKSFEHETAKRGYCANIRGQIIDEILEEGYKYVLYVDADSLVRKDCSKLQTMISQCDITICKRDYEKEINLKFATGVIGFQNNPTTRLFVKKWVKEINTLGIYNWYSDQIGFAKVYHKMKSNLALLPLPISYRDWSFRMDAHLWTGKGDRKYENKIYMLEEAYYQNLFNEQTRFFDKLLLNIKQNCWRVFLYIRYKVIRVFLK